MENSLISCHEDSKAGGAMTQARTLAQRRSSKTGYGPSTVAGEPAREPVVWASIAKRLRYGRENSKKKRNHAVYAVSGAVILAFTAVFAGQVHASCGKSKRMQHRNAECLEASYKNRGWLKDSYAKAKNKCTEYGKVVAKVDIRHHWDRTWHLNDGDEREYKNDWQHIRGVFCCTDLSDLCNKSDIVTPVSCGTKFRESPASATCDAGFGVNDKTECVFTAHCNGGDGETMHLVVAWPDAADLHNCDGTLTAGPC